MKGDFNKLINGDKPVLIDFYADWCAPCKALAPIIKEVAIEMKGLVRFLKVDVDKNQALAQRFDIKGIPTLILFEKGKVAWRHSGLPSKQQLLDAIKQKV